ncbi:molybdenum ABC transporter permease subunit [Iodidimonas nitroreducens]|uniref:Molybdenum transport system permease n=1 Tax=Iodidimonas nitroreducens TaxID=1236968 RepID=A0A5A7N8I9_9PROT|nr:molybdate ABC transporter permease subunit [Iodidimonas nitroreducens]GAK33419.1 molybdenum transport system permease protein ModB [alpha proteobacterium Q-1]GER04663.1 molybdenum ABC transporter permease subunit [Iodidimonas nitroreducens]
MDWTALWLSLRLAGWTVAILLPITLLISRLLAYRNFRGKALAEALIMLPLVLPPTVFGFYLLVGFGKASWIGAFWQNTFGHSLVFSFEGLVVASVLFNLPFAIQPAQRGFEAIPKDLREAAQTCGLSPWRSLWLIELPIAWPGILTAMVLTFAHTLGEFGIVLMVGGAIPGETKTIAIAIYDRVQSFDQRGAALMSGFLVTLSLFTIALTTWLSGRLGWRMSR